MKKHHIEMLKDREFNNFQWHDLVASGVVEYIDTMEEVCPLMSLLLSQILNFVPFLQETTMIAFSPELLHPGEDGVPYCQTWTHCEIHPAMILGKCPTMIKDFNTQILRETNFGESKSP